MTDFDPEDYIAEVGSDCTVDPFDELTNCMENEDAVVALRTLMLEAWVEAWFRKSSGSKYEERPEFHRQVAEREFDRFWERNYE